MKFDEYDFHEKLLAGIKELGFAEPTPVQAETFELIKQNKDIEAQSQTGTGKTAAFLISGFQLLMTDPKFQGRKMLIISPTRELADQIEKEASAIGKFLNLRIGAFYGGVGYGTQEKLLSQGVDVMIGTPGRLLDFVSSGKMDFKDVGILVVDEADRLFDMGFYPDLRQMLRTMSNPEERRTMLFSATLSSQVMNLAWEYMRDPGQIVIEPEHVTVDRIHQELYHVASEEKFGVLLALLKKENPSSAIIFTNTKHSTIRVAKRLELNGYKTEYIMGDLPQSKRLKVIEDVKEGRIHFLVATDVAARGLHINDLDLVVNYDLPLEAENYVHRIGRTARAGKEGKSISLACEKYVYGLKAIEEYIGNKVPVCWMTDAETVEDKSKGVFIPIDEDDSDRHSGRNRGSEGRGSDNRRRPERRGGARRPTGYNAAKPPRPEPKNENTPSTITSPNGDKLTIRSSSLVNEATGVRSMKKDPGKKPLRENNKEAGQTKRKPKSSQGERIAAAAAAVGSGKPSPKNRYNSNGFKKPSNNGKPSTSSTYKPQNKRIHKPSKAGLDSRLDYYKSKYGEDFKAVDVQPDKKEKKPGLLGKIVGLFGLNKKK